MHTFRASRLLAAFLVAVLVFTSAPILSTPAPAAAALPTATLNAVTFVPGSTVVIAVGASGTILRSANDGATWTSVGPGGTYEFVGVSFLDADRGWAITRLGGVFRTTDSGQSWTGPLYIEGQTLQPMGLAYDVAFVAPSGTAHGYAAGGLVSPIVGQDKPRVWARYTANGDGQWSQGVSYDPYLNPATGDYTEVYRNGSGELRAIDFPSSTVGYAVGHDRFYQWWSPITQHNKGLIGRYNAASSPQWSWKTLDPATGPLYATSFATTSRGIAVGTAGKVFRTIDSGTTWSQSLAGSTDLLGAAMTSQNNGWVSGKGGIVGRTTNGGQTWTTQVVASSWVELRDIATRGGGSETAVAVGSSGQIWRTTNGTSWSRVGDETPPTGTVSINSGAAATNSLTVTVSHYPVWGLPDAGQMRHSINGGSTWVGGGDGWITYAPTRTLDLPGPDGTNSVTVQFRDGAGVVSVIDISDSIILDRVAPTGEISINGGAPSTTSAAVTVGHTVDFGPSGPGSMRHSTDGGSTWVGGGDGWVAYADTRVVTLPGAEGEKTVHAEFRDGAGNVSSAPILDTIILETTVPSGTITIEAGAPATKTAGVTVTHDINWASGTAGEMRHSLDGGSTWVGGGEGWVAYSATRSLILSGADGTKTVRAQFKNNLGTVSDVIEDSIVLDTTAPTGTISVDGGAVATNSTNVTVSNSVNFAVSGAHPTQAMRFSLNNGASWTEWESYKGSRALALPLGDGTKTVRGEFRDLAGNTATIIDTIILDQSAPTGSITINGGADATTSTNVTVNNSVTFDAAGPHATQAMRFTVNNGTTWTGWETYNASKALTLPSGDGIKTVTAEFQDRAGNVATLSDTILYAASVTPAPVGVQRLADRTRFSTAIAVARAGFPNWAGVKNVVIASGDDRAAADPLAASGLCWAYDAPMLLVSAARTPDEVKAALKQITDANGTITLRIVGGTTSVPNTRIAELVAAGGGTNKVKVDRILASGGRYDLSAAIALRMRSVAQASPTKTMPSVALFANGADASKFFDALALSPISAGTGAPILLVAADSIPPATQNAVNTLKPSTRIVGGGPNTVSEKVRTQLSATRWSGQSRYDTAIAIANGAVSRGWLNRQNVGIAAKLPDALTGGGFVGQKGGVLLLTDGANLTPATGSWLKTYKAQVKAVHVFGGALSVTETVMGQIRNALR